MNVIIKWNVGPIKKRIEKFCFDIELQLAHETIKRQNGGYLNPMEASIRRDNIIGKLSRGEYAVYKTVILKSI